MQSPVCGGKARQDRRGRESDSSFPARLVVKNSRFFLPEWAAVNDVEFLRSGGNIIVLTLLAVVI